jgi:hypothetical protein
MTDIPSGTRRPIRDTVPLTVTLFGDHDAIGQAISEELERRGCRTHAVSIETGWLSSSTNAIVRLDTAAGASALEGLTDGDGSGAHIVATCVDPDEGPDSERLRHLCEECSASHEVSLICHEPIAATAPGALEINGADPHVRHLAIAVVDEVTEQTQGAGSPSFSTRSIAV